MCSNPVSPSAPPAPVVISTAPATLQQRDDHLRSMKSLVGTLVHALNNTLAPVSGYIALLADEVKPNTPGEHYVTKLQGALDKSEALIDAIVQATHPEKSFLPKETDLTALLHKTTEAWMKRLPADAHLNLLWQVCPCTLWLDENQWTKVIQVLLRNAELAIGRNGTLKITLQEVALSAEEAARIGLPQRTAFELSFEDSGPGMTQEVLQRVCEPLFTTRPHTAISGLGLTLVHSVVQLHGGQLLLESPPDEGTIVRIWLPRI